jgi:hypothetical protein
MKGKLLGSIVGLALLAGCGSSSTTGGASTTSSSTTASSSTSSVAGSGSAAAYAGTWKGTWTNTTFGSNGTVTFDVTITGSDADIKVTLTGNAFGGSAPAPFHVKATYNPDSGFIFRTSSDPFLGDCQGRTDRVGGTSTDCTNIPSARVSELKLSGSWRGDGHAQFSYTVIFRDSTAPATGNVALTKS